jgi:hypothetical protein
MILMSKSEYSMDQKKLKIAYHETGHAVMAVICGQKIQKVSLNEMDSPIGTDKYHAFMKLEFVDGEVKFTFNKAKQKVLISLGGYTSEILFFDGWFSPGGDDLTVAVKNVQAMLQVDEFKVEVSRLPIPDPGPLDMIEIPLVRAYIGYMLDESLKV